MKKICAGLVAVAFFLALVLLLVVVISDKLIDDYSQQAVHFLLGEHPSQGLVLEQLSFSEVNRSSFDTIVWHDVSAAMTFQAKNGIFSGRKLAVHLDDVTFNLESIIDPKIRCSVSGVTVMGVPMDLVSHGMDEQHFDRLTDGKASIQLELNFFNKDVAIQQLKDIWHDLRGLLDSGRSKYPFAFSAVCSFEVRGEKIKALLSVEQEGAEYFIVLNPEALEIISWLFEEKLTIPEVELLSRNPFRTPKLLRIKVEAQSVSSKAHEENNVVPEDAYRHILWSYLLTKNFGPDFAERVTDAHEQGITDNTEAEHRMDFINNRIGRQYALHKFRKEEILAQLFQDRQVVRQAR